MGSGVSQTPTNNIILKGVTEEERKVLLQVSRKVNENIKGALQNLDTGQEVIYAE